ncbi:hypothetical protein, partial [Bradyrhizobium sp.]|uniref:hypothetical protein n=1 Tax=Bradyrhizobium sp. TaxID=376 RepID=UPI002725ADB5
MSEASPYRRQESFRQAKLATQSPDAWRRENADVHLLLKVDANSHRVVARSACDEAIHLSAGTAAKWIASSQALLAMTLIATPPPPSAGFATARAVR